MSYLCKTWLEKSFCPQSFAMQRHEFILIPCAFVKYATHEQGSIRKEGSLGELRGDTGV